MPEVSVIIPAYQQGLYLGEAIASALAQTMSDLEVVVVDDGSTDDTRKVVRSFTDSRLRYVYQENRGLSAARNKGIEVARGRFLTFLDADDAFLPDKLQVLRAAMTGGVRYGLGAGQAVLIDENGTPTGEVFERGLPADPGDLLLGNPLHVGSVLLDSEWQERAGPFDESLRSYEDWDMWLRLARLGCPMVSVATPVSLYRFHRGQMTRLGDQMTSATFAVLEKTFSDPRLPPAWPARRAEAYGRGHLRAAAQAYTGADFRRAIAHMSDAVRLDPGLVREDAEPLARLIAGWANHAKTAEPMAFLEAVYANLPGDLPSLKRRRRRDLAREAVHLAFEAERHGQPLATWRRLRQAIRYKPSLLLDRALVGITLRSVRASLARRRPSISSARTL